jgi:hypothetical protein
MSHSPHCTNLGWRLAALQCAQVGPELEVCGYGCEDHFNELDTVEHSWEALAVSTAAAAQQQHSMRDWTVTAVLLERLLVPAHWVHAFCSVWCRNSSCCC